MPILPWEETGAGKMWNDHVGGKGTSTILPWEETNAGRFFNDHYGGGKKTPKTDLEPVVRPFIWAETQPKNAAPARPKLPGEDTEAFISWGKASSFIQPAQDPYVDPTGEQIPPGDGGFNTNPDRDKDDEPPTDDEKTIAHNEEWRCVEKVKVTNPEDPEDYVWILRPFKVAFRNSKTGILNVFVLDNSGANATIVRTIE